MMRNCIRACVFVLAVFLFAGCASSKINWAERIGNYTYDQAVLELGPPDKSAKLSDGTVVAEWMTSRGSAGYSGFGHGYSGFYNYSLFEPATPDHFWRLTFDPEG